MAEDSALTGLTVVYGEEMTRIRVSCQHQNGLLYFVPAERSWVCDSKSLPAHALAGFFRELTQLNHPAVKDLMQQWGLYYRELPHEGDPPGPAEETPAS